MGHRNLYRGLTFDQVRDHVDSTHGWRYVFEALAGEALGPAMRAKRSDHVDCPFPSHGGKGDFRLNPGWDQPGRSSGWGICTCAPRGLDGFDILYRLGLYSTTGEALKAVAALTGLSDSDSAPKARPIRQPIRQQAKGPDPEWTPGKSAGRAKLYDQWWSEGLRLDHPEAEIGRIYLRNRGIDLKGVLPNVRFHPRMRVITGGQVSYWPALLFDISQPNGKRAGLHRVFLSDAGKKAPFPKPKRFTPFIPQEGYQGCAARVVTVDDCTTLNIAEGPENTLVAYLCTAETSWCTLDSTRLKQLKVPAFFKKVRIWADNDAKGAGAQAASALCNRLLAQGFEVEIMMPWAEPGVDWNDLFVSTNASVVSLSQRLTLMRRYAEPEGLAIAA